MRCASCGASLDSHAKFCSACGKSVTGACSKCGATVAPDAKFCPACGTGLGAATAAVAMPSGWTNWWGPMRNARGLDRLFQIGVAAFLFGSLLVDPLPLAPFKLCALGIGIYLLYRGDTKRGATLVVASVAAILILSSLHGAALRSGGSAGFRSGGGGPSNESTLCSWFTRETAPPFCAKYFPQ